MAKKQDTKARASKLTAVAKTIANTLAGLDDAKGEVIAICKSVQSLYRGAEIPGEEMDYMLDEISRHRRWTNKSADKRKSEARAVIAASALLPECIARVEKAGLPVAFYNAVKLARKLNSGMTPNQAATAFLKGGSSTATPPAKRSKENAWKSVNTHFKRIVEHTQLPPQFRKAVMALRADFAELDF